MALNHFLSAMRTLILDEAPPTGSQDERLAALRTRFADLSDAEIRDLAAIPPKRIQVYTDLVFAGERELLRWVYPVTFAVLHGIWEARDDDPSFGEADFELVRAVHRYRAWPIGSTRLLAKNMADYIAAERGEWLVAWGGLPSLMDCEQVELAVFYAMDSEFAPLDVDGLINVSVEDLMAMNVVMPSYAAVRDFTHDVLGLMTHWRQHDALPDGLPDRTETMCACGRNPQTLVADWVRLSPAGRAALRTLESDKPTPVEVMAGAFVEASDDADREDERAMFESFFTLLGACATAGVLLDGRVSG